MTTTLERAAGQDQTSAEAQQGRRLGYWNRTAVAVMVIFVAWRARRVITRYIVGAIISWWRQGRARVIICSVFSVIRPAEAVVRRSPTAILVRRTRRTSSAVLSQLR